MGGFLAINPHARRGMQADELSEPEGTSSSDANAGRMRAAVDGEPEELETPLRFEIEPGALRVLLPPGL